MNPGRKPATSDQEAMKSDTSKKLDWLNCVFRDRSLNATTKTVAFLIADSINWKTGKGRLSSETIEDELGIKRTAVFEAKRALTGGGWIRAVQPDRTSATVYTLETWQIEGALDERTRRSDERRQRRENRAETAYPDVRHSEHRTGKDVRIGERAAAGIPNIRRSRF